MEFLYIALVGALITVSYGEVCTKPEISSKTYTTQDATVLTNLAFIVEFTLKCGNGAQGISLHAEVEGQSLPAVRVSDNTYQVSWSEEPRRARSGTYPVALYDDEGFAALRKAIRNGDDTSSIRPLVTVDLHFPGAYQGPWINSELMAVFLSIFVSYVAYSARSKLLA